MRVEIHTETKSEANQREHWSKKARRARAQRQSAALMLSTLGKPPPMPVTVTLRRVCPPRSRIRDDDNLVSAFKAIRDEVARWLGVDDSSADIMWRYEQETRKATPAFYSVVVEIKPREAWAEQYVMR